jgi:hypothetical protein
MVRYLTSRFAITKNAILLLRLFVSAEDVDARFGDVPVLCKPLDFEAFEAAIAKFLSLPGS